ncbi:hypothetical protein UFOVP1454_6 [uncultured Caudovirales phage]|uniref:Uncharacterized protein n=1 Tax=uncultured Caudovirales phage TaxID=2100421 RepID=A0A6J5SH49_9CAUD|nr:hypothetical protein UFOVP1454_6 [uncultured Caudovirales phage]
MTFVYQPQISIAPLTLDALNKLPTAASLGLFNAQFTYDLQPIVFEAITNGSGATVTHDATNRSALMTFSSTPTGGKAYMQSYEYLRYQPGNAQGAIITFNMLSSVANCIKFVRYGDAVNAYQFSNDGTNNIFSILSSTTSGNQIKNQTEWNLDKLDGSSNAANPSGHLFDITKEQLFIVDIAALYTEGAKFGFVINGINVWCHRFSFSNVGVYAYIADANLPASAGMTCTGTVSTTMSFHCCAVYSSGGSIITPQYQFSQEGTATAASGVDTHLLSIRPLTTFNSITNRTNLVPNSINMLVTGNSPILWKLVVGQAITGTTTFTTVNSTFAAAEYNTAGTASGSPAIVVDQGYVAASNQAKGIMESSVTFRYPICLDAAGAVGINRTMSLLVQGIGGASACRGSIIWYGAR